MRNLYFPILSQFLLLCFLSRAPFRFRLYALIDSNLARGRYFSLLERADTQILRVNLMRTSAFSFNPPSFTSAFTKPLPPPPIADVLHRWPLMNKYVLRISWAVLWSQLHRSKQIACDYLGKIPSISKLVLLFPNAKCYHF